MRLLFAIPHFFGRQDSPGRHGSEGGDPQRRIEALSSCIHALHQLYGSRQCVMNIEQRRALPANRSQTAEVHVVICTAGSQHLLDQLPVDRRMYHHLPSDVEASVLGFQCHKVLRDRLGNYDYYGYLEDDLILHDPWLFTKLAWFNGHVGQGKLLLPNRFERGGGRLVTKAYVDGEIARRVTDRFQNIDDQPRLESQLLGRSVVFLRPTNPHSGCFFLNAEQMRSWMSRPYFLDSDISFIGPLESAATLSVMKAFQVYKPAWDNADFLEIEHHGDQFLRQIRVEE